MDTRKIIAREWIYFIIFACASGCLYAGIEYLVKPSEQNYIPLFSSAEEAVESLEGIYRESGKIYSPYLSEEEEQFTEGTKGYEGFDIAFEVAKEIVAERFAAYIEDYQSYRTRKNIYYTLSNWVEPPPI